jgi:hypothetical protein
MRLAQGKRGTVVITKIIMHHGRLSTGTRKLYSLHSTDTEAVIGQPSPVPFLSLIYYAPCAMFTEARIIF